MPKIARVNVQDLLTLLSESKDIFNQNGKLRGPHQPVWLDISRKLEGKMKPNYVYQRVKQNRGGLLDQLKEIHGVKQSDGIHDRLQLELSETETSESRESPESAVIKPNKTFILTIPALEWTKIAPVETKYKRTERGKMRNVMVLPQYRWEDTLVNLLWEQHKIPCPYSFVRGRVYVDQVNREHYIKVEADCTDCGSSAVGTILQEPVEGETVSMEWRCPDTRRIAHTKKRQLAGDLRTEVAKDIAYSSALIYRRIQADKLMDSGDVQPPHLYSNDVLRKAKQEYKNINSNVVHGPDPIMCLELMKHQQPHCGSIHDIGQDSFFVHYYTPSQLHVYKQFHSTEYTVLAVDATGSVASRILRLHGPSKHIFLYQGVMITASFSCPVVQMLSEKQDANSILYWLNEWERAGAPSPKEAVTDNSAAIKSALARSFGRCSDIKEYKEKCFFALRGVEKYLPPCFIRLDVAHYIKAAQTWSVYKNKSQGRLKDFFLRCLGLLIKAQSLNNFEEIMIHILILTQSEAEGEDEEGDELPMEHSLRFLINKIKGQNVDHNESICEDAPSKHYFPENCDTDSPNCIKEWVDSLRIKAANKIPNKSSSFLRLNPYYSKEIAEDFLRVTYDFVLWSAVMVPYFDSPYLTASSAHVEGEFETIKHKILIGEKRPLQPHKLVGIHLQSISGYMKIAGSEKNTKTEMSQRTDIASDAVVTVPTLNLNEFACATSDEDKTYRIAGDAVATDQEIHLSDSSDKENIEPCITLEEESAPSDLNCYENWRNKMGQQRRRNRKFKYLTACPELDAALNDHRLKQPRNNLLTNGSRTGFIKLNSKTYVKTSNTCAFDALTTVIANGYIEIEQYRSCIDTSSNHLLKTARSLATVGAVSATYKLRAEALSTIKSPATLPKSNIKKRDSVSLLYDAWDNVSHMAKNLLKHVHSLKIAVKCTAVECNRPKEINYTILDSNLQLILNKGFGFLAEAVAKSLALDANENITDSEQCILPHCINNCQGSPTMILRGQNHILIDVDYMGCEHPNYVNLPHNKPHKLQDLPLSIAIAGKKYILLGVIAFSPGHYTAYNRKISTSTWDCHDDLSSKVVTNVSPTQEILPHLLYYVYP